MNTMHKIILGLLVSILISCGTGKTSETNQESPIEKYAAEIKADDLKEHLYLLSSDILEGRKTGEKGQKMAVNYLTAYYEHLNLKSPEAYLDYQQPIPKAFFNDKSSGDSQNVLAYVEGSEFPDEVVVISAHYDHLGIKGDDVYNGADDNASGTSAVMEIAQSFQMAKNEGYGPKRSILFLHLTGEELGLYGSKYYVQHPVFSLDSTLVDLNIDMVGRIDAKHESNNKYVYLIGSDRLSTDLHELSEATNKKYTHLKLDYMYNEQNDPHQYFTRSDHFNFASQNIPVIFYFSGTHPDYHKVTDTADKIDFDILSLRAQLVFYTAWEIANRDTKLILDAK